MSEPVAGQGTSEPVWIGPYRILEILGEGGMGTVYLAEQRSPVLRRVALKVVKLGMDTKAVLARFQAEGQILAMLEHSCIARIFDAGVSADGRPYFAMEYVKGIPITTYCDENKLSLRDRIDLFSRVCDGVQHAHHRGIVHRDLKPSNILVSVQDGHPEPRIIDFGLAKALNQRLVEATIFTEQGQIIGTPEYMSPEQAGLGGLSIDARTDVYSLGVLLYELLTGVLPFSRRELQGAAYHELQRIIRETEPPRPSTKLTLMGEAAKAAASCRQLDLRALRRQLAHGLDWIVLQALTKDRTRRYQTPKELADDLERHLQGQRIIARPRALTWQAGWLTRWRAVTAALLLALALAAWLVLGKLPGAAHGGAYRRVLAVNPPDAPVFINGERHGTGDSRPVRLDFGAFSRCYVQATHPDYNPELLLLTEDQVQDMIATGTDIRITLRPR